MLRSLIKRRFQFGKICLLILLFGVSGIANAEVNEKKDFQVWNHQSLQIPLTAKWELLGAAEFRYGDNASFFFEKFYQIQAVYKLFLWLNLSPGYRQMFTRSRASLQWTPMYIPLIDVFLHGCLSQWKVSNRFRAQYQIKESIDKEWLYRNRLRLVTPWRFTRLCMSPYVDEEVFFLQDEGFFQNRLSAGVMTAYSPSFNTKLFYMLKHEKIENQWAFQHVVGFSFAFEF